MGLAAGLYLTAVSLPAALTLQIAMLVWLGRPFWLPGLIYALFLAAILASGLWQFDPSYDGNGYHRAAALCLREGWNPIQGETCAWQWTNDYPMLSWLYAAGQMTFTGFAEAGMSINLVVAAGAGLTGFWCFRMILDRGPFLPAVLALTSVGNPVFFTQVWSTYVDALVYLFTMTGLLGIGVLCVRANTRSRQLAHIVIAVSVGSLVALKFSAAVYAALILVSALTLTAIKFARREETGLSKTSVIYGLIGIASLCVVFHPYATHILNDKHIFHPLMGSEASEFVTELEPDCVKDNSRLTRPFFAMLYDTSVTTHGCTAETAFRPVTAYIPGRHLHEFDRLSPGRWTLAGFGPYMPLHMLLAAVCFSLLLLPRIFKLTASRAALLLGGLVLLMSVQFSSNWWARYVPQLWLLIPLGVLVLQGLPKLPRISSTFLILAVAGLTSAASAWAVTLSISDWSADTRQIPSGLLTQENAALSQRSQAFLPSYRERSRRLGWPELTPQSDTSVNPVFNAFPITITLRNNGPLAGRPSLQSILDNRDWTILAAGKDESTRSLLPCQQEAFERRGIPIGELQYRGSFVAYIQQDRSGYRIQNESAAHLNVALEFPELTLKASLYGAGYAFGNAAIIDITGANLSRNERGINLVVLDSEGRYLGSLNYDTFKGSPGEKCL